MTYQSEKLISLKSALSERELHILDIELERRKKSTGVTYFLWFFLGWFAIHKFYLNNIAGGIIYLIAPWLAIILLVFGVMVHDDAEFGAPTAMVGLLALVAYGIWMLVDLFTIPRQVTTYNEKLELEIIPSLNARKEAPGSSPELLVPR